MGLLRKRTSSGVTELSSPARRKRMDTELVRTRYNKNRDLVHLKPKYSRSEEELIDAWT